MATSISIPSKQFEAMVIAHKAQSKSKVSQAVQRYAPAVFAVIAMIVWAALYPAIVGLMGTIDDIAAIRAPFLGDDPAPLPQANWLPYIVPTFILTLLVIAAARAVHRAINPYLGLFVSAQDATKKRRINKMLYILATLAVLLLIASISIHLMGLTTTALSAYPASNSAETKAVLILHLLLYCGPAVTLIGVAGGLLSTIVCCVRAKAATAALIVPKLIKWNLIWILWLPLLIIIAAIIGVAIGLFLIALFMPLLAAFAGSSGR